MPRDRSTARRLLIRRLLLDRRIPNQTELAGLLEEAGHTVTQSTVSRDLAELGAVKTGEGTESEHYVIGRHRETATKSFDRLRRVLEQDLEAALPSGNLLVLKVRVASAHPVASALDEVSLEGVLGTVAGDDTVLVVADGPRGGSAIEKRIMEILEA